MEGHKIRYVEQCLDSSLSSQVKFIISRAWVKQSKIR